MGTSTRITGLMSGMDTDEVIKKMMDAEKITLNNYEKDKTKVEWQREALLGLNSDMLSFQNNAFDMKLSSAYRLYNYTSTNNNIVTANASSGDVLEGSYSIRVNQLATASTWMGEERQETIISENGFDYDMLIGALEEGDYSLNITLGDITKTITLTIADMDNCYDAESLAEYVLQGKINDAFGAQQIDVTGAGSGGDSQMYFRVESALNPSLKVTSGEGNDLLSLLGIESGSVSAFNTSQTLGTLTGNEADIEFSINGHQFSFSAGTTLTQMFKTVSDDEDADVTLKYDTISKKIILTRDSLGEGRNLDLVDSTGLFNGLGFRSENVTGDGQEILIGATNQIIQQGTNAIVSLTDPNGQTINGIQVPSNTLNYNGVAFNLSKADPAQEVTVTVNKDVDAIYDKIVGFIDKYNTLLEKLNKLYNEEVNKDYEPLTEEEKEELSETQQEKWEKLARSGLLRRDSTIQAAVSSMRNAVMETVTSTGLTSLFQIGISTTAYSATNNNNGKLILDEDGAKLKEAISNNYKDVVNIFTSTPDFITGDELNPGTNFSGQSISLTVNNRACNVTLSQDYDISTSEGQTGLVDEINNALSAQCGAGSALVTFSNGRIVISSNNNSNIVVNSASVLGIDAGAKYDSAKIGFASKMYSAMSTAIKSVTQKAGSATTTEDESTLGKRFENLNDYITKEKDRLERLEDRYYSQFSAMEQALANLQSQSSYISNLLGSNQQ